MLWEPCNCFAPAGGPQGAASLFPEMLGRRKGRADAEGLWAGAEEGKMSKRI